MRWSSQIHRSLHRLPACQANIDDSGKRLNGRLQRRLLDGVHGDSLFLARERVLSLPDNEPVCRGFVLDAGG